MRICFKLYTPAAPEIRLTFERKTNGSSGYDLHANIGLPRLMNVGERWIFKTGVALSMPPGIEAQVRPRSGLTANCGVIAQLGTIDADYRGEISVTMINLGTTPYTVNPGDRIAQIVFVPVVLSEPEQVESLSETARGSSGFGSTGR